VTDCYLGNDHVLVIENLADAVTEAVLNTATITYQIYDASDDSAVAGASGTLTQNGTAGHYSCEITHTIANLLEKGGEYYITLTGIQSGYNFEFNIDIIAKKRGRG
jgi:hypothetical protein